MFYHLILAIQFYTCVPLPAIKKKLELKDLAYSLAYGPVAGIIVAFLLKQVFDLSLWLHLQPFTAAIILFVAYFSLTGGIHFDGVADTFDAVGSTAKGEKLLKVLKDPTIGSFGGVFLILVVIQYLYYFYRIIPFDPPFYVWAWPFVVSRSMPVFLSLVLPYMKGDQNSYRNTFVDLVSWRQLLIVLFWLVAFQLFLIPVAVWLSLGIILGGTLLVSYLFIRIRFGSINGDMLGASILFLEIVYFHWMLHGQLV